jgi:hypothetical protein
MNSRGIEVELHKNGILIYAPLDEMRIEHRIALKESAQAPQSNALIERGLCRISMSMEASACLRGCLDQQLRRDRA